MIEVITDAAELGYNVVSFSGGEPLLYKGLDKLLRHSKSLGLGTYVTTNGTILSKDKVQELKGLLDLLAISLDGPPSLHNEIRESINAFDLLIKGIDTVKRTGLRFGFIHTLTRQSWEHLLWIAEFAAGHGASLLQVHPLEMVGRAGLLMQSSYAQDEVIMRAYLLLVTLAIKYKNSMHIQFDVHNKEYVKENPSAVYADDFNFENYKNSNLSELINPLVVEADGNVVPVSYGFSKQYALCNIKNERLSVGQSVYLNQRSYDQFRRLCKVVFRNILNSQKLVLFNWYELVASKSQEA